MRRGRQSSRATLCALRPCRNAAAWGVARPTSLSPALRRGTTGGEGGRRGGGEKGARAGREPPSTTFHASHALRDQPPLQLGDSCRDGSPLSARRTNVQLGRPPARRAPLSPPFPGTERSGKRERGEEACVERDAGQPRQRYTSPRSRPQTGCEPTAETGGQFQRGDTQPVQGLEQEVRRRPAPAGGAALCHRRGGRGKGAPGSRSTSSPHSCAHPRSAKRASTATGRQLQREPCRRGRSRAGMWDWAQEPAARRRRFPPPPLPAENGKKKRGGRREGRRRKGVRASRASTQHYLCCRRRLSVDVHF